MGILATGLASETSKQRVLRLYMLPVHSGVECKRERRKTKITIHLSDPYSNSI